MRILLRVADGKCILIGHRSKPHPAKRRTNEQTVNSKALAKENTQKQGLTMERRTPAQISCTEECRILEEIYNTRQCDVIKRFGAPRRMPRGPEWKFGCGMREALTGSHREYGLHELAYPHSTGTGNRSLASGELCWMPYGCNWD